MPFLIPLAAGVLVAAEVVTGWAAFFLLVGASLLSGWLEMQMMDQPSDMGTKVSTRTTAQELFVIYGREMVAGNDVVMDTFSTGSSTPNDELMIVQAIGEGPCHGVALAKETWKPRQSYAVDDIVEHEGSIYICILAALGESQKPPNATYWASDSGTAQVYLDDIHYTEYQAISDWYCTYQFISGSFTQVYSDYSMLTDLYNRTSGRPYPYNDNYRGTCCLAWHLGWDNEGRVFHGMPTRTALIKGRLLYDFRDSSTAWSDNPVLALYDYMTDTRYGLGISSSKLDAGVSGTWTDAANYCDTKYWKINLAIRQKNAWDVIGTIMKLFRGQLVWYDDVFYLYYADTTDESETGITIDDDYILRDEKGKALISISQPSRFNKPDALRGAFLNPRKEWTLDHIVIGESLGKIENLELIGCNDPFHCSDLTVYALERMQLDRTISFPGRDDLLQLDPHDLVRLDSTTYGLTNELMRVVQSEIRMDGLINLQLQYEDDTLYNDDYDIDVNELYECVIPDPFAAIAPSGLSVAISTDTMGYDIPIIIATLTWTSTGNRQTKYYLIQWRTIETLWATSTGYTVGNVRKNDNEYYICISNHTSSASDEPGTGANWETYWELSPWPNKARIDATLTTTMIHRISGVYNGTWDFRVRSVNYNGVASTWVLHQEIVNETADIGAYKFTMPKEIYLLGYWDFEAGSGTIVYDKSGWASNGTFGGSSPAWTTGISGHGFSAPGTDERVNCGNTSIISTIGQTGGNPDVSFSFWMNGDSTPNNYGALIGKWTDSNTKFFIGSYGTNNQLFVSCKKGGNGNEGAFSDIDCFDDSWHHVVVIVDLSNDIIRVYMDAVESATTIDISSLSSGWDNSSDLCIGAVDASGNLPYDGMIDEVRIYNRVLTHQEIRALYYIPSGNQSIVYGDSRLDGNYLTVGPNTERGEYATLELALADLSTIGASGIFIKNGTYDSSSTITLPSQDVTVIGQSEEGVILRSPTGTTTFITRNTDYDTQFLNLTFTSRHTGAGYLLNFATSVDGNVLIKDVTINGYSESDNCIWLNGVEGKTVIDNVTINGGSIGVEIRNCWAVRVINSTINGCANGIQLYALSFLIGSTPKSQDVTISNNHFYNCGVGVQSSGIWTYAVNSITVTGNVVVSNDYSTSTLTVRYGIVVDAKTGSIAGNSVEIYDDYGSITSVIGILLRGSDITASGNNVLITNALDLNGIYGIDCQADNSSIVGNSIVVDASYATPTYNRYGINCSGDYCQITGNQIDLTNNDAKDIGVGLLAANGTNTIGNIMLNCGDAEYESGGGSPSNVWSDNRDL